ncbi:MAG: ATP-binding protein [Peptococcaceae bacterium]|nr:ATP-binding protein [Peptococcaceae bacterium]
MNNKLAIEIIGLFDSISIVTPISNVSDTVEYMLQNDTCRQTVLKYIKRADIGIEDFSFTVSNVNAQEETKVPIEALADARFRVTKETKEIDVKSKHAVFGTDGRVVSHVELPFVEYQSQGTIRLFELLGPILGSLDKGRVVIVDELGTQLHPKLVRFILSLFNAIDTNVNNAQLVCNSHDALLLEERVRRDQIWFAQKNDVGESELYSLDEFKDTRKDDPFVKKYLLGVFGATPQPNKGDF